jgi:RNA recognition motif-containing protein
MHLFIGNLTCAMRSEDLAKLFWPYGFVREISLHTRWEGMSTRTYARVEMPDQDAERAMQALDGYALADGRRFIVRRWRSDTGTARRAAAGGAA